MCQNLETVYWCPKYGRTLERMCDADALGPMTEHETLEQHEFREKLRYWREHGAPAYHGPRAVR
jgi:hypothetical protein